MPFGVTGHGYEYNTAWKAPVSPSRIIDNLYKLCYNITCTNSPVRMNNPAHNGSHFNRQAEELARSGERQRFHRHDVPSHMMAQTEAELMELLRGTEHHD
jgi:hypothetical protein